MITEPYGIDHAQSLTVVMPALLRFKLKKKVMLARMARQVWGVDTKSDADDANAAVDRIEDFFRTIHMPVTLSELTPVVVSTEDGVGHLERAGQTALGERFDISPDKVIKILELAK